MATRYTVFVLDEHWGGYADGYSVESAWSDVCRVVPGAELVAMTSSLLAADVGRVPPAALAGHVRCDAVYFQSDNEASLRLLTPAMVAEHARFDAWLALEEEL